MRWLAGLALGVVMVAGTASAQLPRSGGTTGDMRDLPGGKNPKIRYDEGVKALQEKNWLMAQGAFRDVLDADSSNGNAHFMMGLAELGLNDLEGAKKEFAIAARMRPKLPDPKGRLGYLLAREGDIAGANQQRADLVGLDKACKQKCPDAQGIQQGIALIDAALKAGPVKAAPAAITPVSPSAPDASH
jgi:tetratricopeptide (TPR) repeat protein